MKVTELLQKWLVEHKGLSADSSEDDFRKAAADAMLDGSLDNDTFAKLTKDPDGEKSDALMTVLTKLAGRLEALEQKTSDSVEKETPEKQKPEPSEKTTSRFDRLFAGSDGASLELPDDAQIRHVTAAEQYNKASSAMHFPVTTRKGSPHPLAGRRAYEGGTRGMRLINEPSEYDRAVAGAYFKWCLEIESRGRLPQGLRMNDHEKELIQDALQNANWGGTIHGEGSEVDGAIAVKNRKLTPSEIKAILDDSASGGLEIAPIMFDDQIITTPLLHGEFFPRVNVVNITRGRRIEGASMANVTLNSAGADGTAIDLENTASFISAFDTTIFVVDGAIELGLDFLSDSPVSVGDMVTTSYGEQMLAWLDEQICVGDGTTEPEGITNATGTTTVNADNGATGPPTVGDYETLLFGVTKAFKRGAADNRIAFGANETSYQRARGIAVGATDERRVFGMTHEDYRLLGRDYGINSNFNNRTAVFANFSRYRMYRRLGLTIKSTSEGKELVRNNLLLIAARARFGGQLEDGNAAAVQSDGQS